MTAGPIALMTASAEETREAGAAVAAALVPGDVVSLTGDLGAGKTTLVQGAARALGVRDPVASPTFVLVREYRGTVPVYHLDVYRLDQMQEALDLGLAEMLDDGGVVLIEWGDAILPVLPHDLLEVRLTLGDGDDDRTITVRPVGLRWAARGGGLEAALAPWARGADA